MLFRPQGSVKISALREESIGFWTIFPYDMGLN